MGQTLAKSGRPQEHLDNYLMSCTAVSAFGCWGSYVESVPAGKDTLTNCG